VWVYFMMINNTNFTFQLLQCNCTLSNLKKLTAQHFDLKYNCFVVLVQVHWWLLVGWCDMITSKKNFTLDCTIHQSSCWKLAEIPVKNDGMVRWKLAEIPSKICQSAWINKELQWLSVLCSRIAATSIHFADIPTLIKVYDVSVLCFHKTLA